MSGGKVENSSSIRVRRTDFSFMKVSMVSTMSFLERVEIQMESFTLHKPHSRTDELFIPRIIPEPGL